MDAEQRLEPLSEAARRLQEANQLAEQRQAKAEERDDMLKRIIGELDSRIRKDAPLCEGPLLASGWKWRLNGAVLRVDPVQLTKVDVAVSHRYYTFYTVYAYTSINIIYPYPAGQITLSASLWYGDANSLVRWYEVSFRQPDIAFYVALSPEDASFSLDKKEYIVDRIALINEQAFTEKWITHFGEAAQVSGKSGF